MSSFIDKEPQIKGLTNDKIIKITGESGSSKSDFSDTCIKDDNYIVVAANIVFSNKLSDNKASGKESIKYIEEEYQKYANKKLGMFYWYHSLNDF